MTFSQELKMQTISTTVLKGMVRVRQKPTAQNSQKQIAPSSFTHSRINTLA